MSRAPRLIATALLLAACSHAEDRRWKALLDPPARGLPPEEMPTVQVYSFSPPKPQSAKPTVKDFSDHGQAAIVAAIAAKSADPDALRKALAAPIAANPTPDGVDDRTQLARTLVVSINKGPGSKPGDRLVRTVVTVTPGLAAGKPQFEYAGYTVAATDTKVQNIAHLEDQTDLSIKAALAPKIGGFGDNGVEGSVGHTRKSTADIVQQYEHLSVDITPATLVVTRESERGLDVVGNTLVALTLAAPSDADTDQNFIVSAQKLFDGPKPLSAEQVTLTLSPLRTFGRADLTAKVELAYLLRRIVDGREFYTEGKQRVQLVSGESPRPITGSKTPGKDQVLVRAADVQPRLWQICAREPGHGSVHAFTADGRSMLLTYDDLDGAREMATWLERGTRSTVGADRVSLRLSADRPLPPGIGYFPTAYNRGCGPLPPKAVAAVGVGDPR